MTKDTLDLAALQRWLSALVPVSGPLTAERISGGQSNPTFRVRAGEGRWVLRKKPLSNDCSNAYRTTFSLLRKLSRSFISWTGTTRTRTKESNTWPTSAN